MFSISGQSGVPIRADQHGALGLRVRVLGRVQRRRVGMRNRFMEKAQGKGLWKRYQIAILVASEVLRIENMEVCLRVVFT